MIELFRKLTGFEKTRKNGKNFPEFIQDKFEWISNWNKNDSKKRGLTGKWSDTITFQELREFQQILKLRMKVEYMWKNTSLHHKFVDESLLYKWNTHLNGKRYIINQIDKFLRNPERHIQTMKDSLELFGEKRKDIQVEEIDDKEQVGFTP